MSTFVSVGNAKQPFPRLLLAVIAIAPRLPQPVVIQSGATPIGNFEGEANAYIPMDEFAGRIKEARVVITHAGAGTIIHSILSAKIPVVMPRRAAYAEHIDDHQVELSRSLERTGKVVVAMEASDLEAAVTRAIALQARAPSGSGNPAILKLVSARLEEYAAGTTRP